MGKSMKPIIWTAIIFFVIYFVLLTQGDNNDEDIKLIMNVILGCAFVLIGIAAFYLIYTIIENKKFSKLLDVDDYNGVIALATKKVESKRTSPERLQYYYYLLLLSYFSLEDNENVDKYFELLYAKSLFPIVNYWKACYEVAKGNKEGAKYFNDFLESPETKRNANKYQNIFLVVEAIIAYAEDRIEDAKKKASEVDIDRLSMPSSKKCIQLIRNLEIIENEKEA